ncbi:MAG: hypothetical protein WC725_02810 [Patescibacteria group bacterium]|jgi:hypothetical protein
MGLFAWFSRLVRGTLNLKSQREDTEVCFDEKPLPLATDEIRVENQSEELVKWKCGHLAPARFAHIIYGAKYELYPEYFGERLACGECLLAKLIERSLRCGKCGHIIFQDEGLALYVDDRKLFVNRYWITFFEGSVVGCMRTDCCPSGAYFFANWDGEKIVPRFGGKTVFGEAMSTGKPVCGSVEL